MKVTGRQMACFCPGVRAKCATGVPWLSRKLWDFVYCDISQAQALLHGEEQAAFGDAGYLGVEKRPESAEATVEWHVAEKPSKVKTLAGTALGDLVAQIEHAKASIRAKVEHPFHVVKNLFKHRKTRYKGLAKNTSQLLTLFGLANLVLARRWLSAADGRVAS